MRLNISELFQGVQQYDNRIASLQQTLDLPETPPNRKANIRLAIDILQNLRCDVAKELYRAIVRCQYLLYANSSFIKLSNRETQFLTDYENGEYKNGNT